MKLASCKYGVDCQHGQDFPCVGLCALERPSNVRILRPDEIPGSVSSIRSSEIVVSVPRDLARQIATAREGSAAIADFCCELSGRIRLAYVEQTPIMTGSLSGQRFSK